MGDVFISVRTAVTVASLTVRLVGVDAWVHNYD
jgi:hypothetical protein